MPLLTKIRVIWHLRKAQSYIGFDEHNIRMKPQAANGVGQLIATQRRRKSHQSMLATDGSVRELGNACALPDGLHALLRQVFPLGVQRTRQLTQTALPNIGLELNDQAMRYLRISRRGETTQTSSQVERP